MAIEPQVGRAGAQVADGLRDADGLTVALLAGRHIETGGQQGADQEEPREEGDGETRQGPAQVGGAGGGEREQGAVEQAGARRGCEAPHPVREPAKGLGEADATDLGRWAGKGGCDFHGLCRHDEPPTVSLG